MWEQESGVGERKRASRSLWKCSVIAVWRCGPVIIQEEVRAAGHGVGRKEPLLLIPALIYQQLLRCIRNGITHRVRLCLFLTLLLLGHYSGLQMTLFL